MSDKINNKIIEEYLLGNLKDETQRTRIEERLAVDQEFYQRLELLEDDLIEKYLSDELGAERLDYFNASFLSSVRRRKKIVCVKALRKHATEINILDEMEQSQEDKLNGFWNLFSFRPKLVFSAALSLLLITVFGVWFFVSKPDNDNNYIAQIEFLQIESRPVQGRIFDFEYRPYGSLRGNDDSEDSSMSRKRRIIETKLLESIEDDSNVENLNALGVFYLTERKYDEAIKYFEEALGTFSDDKELISKLDDSSKVRSNLSLAYFEKALMVKESDEKLTFLAKALEEVSDAIKQGDQRHELLFNRALILQEMNVPRQAIEAWKLYLEKDPKSKWSDDANKRLKELESKKKKYY